MRGSFGTPAFVPDGRATRADIEACFRLLLGRAPNREERAGHFAHVGRDLSTVVSGYLNSREFRGRELLAATTSPPQETTQDGVFILADPDNLAVGRHVLAGVAFEPHVAQAVRRRLRPGSGMIDLGANIGTMALAAAALVGPTGYVLAVEPNGRNARLLEASRRRNGFDHLTVAQCAAAPAPELLVLYPSFSNGTTAPPPDSLPALLAAETVQALPPDLLVPPGRRIDLIKADVEGAEHRALRGCAGIIARDHPDIVSEFSPNLLPGISGISGPTYIEWLQSLDYQIRVIEPDGTETPKATAADVMASYEAHGASHIDIVACQGLDPLGPQAPDPIT